MITVYMLLFLPIPGLIWLGYAYFKLHRNHQLLKNNVDRINRDLAGLCASAIVVDSKITNNNSTLQLAADVKPVVQIPEQEQVDEEVSDQDYQDVIQKVRKGMDSTELVKQCGVSFDEAALLVRLYGTAK